MQFVKSSLSRIGASELKLYCTSTRLFARSTGMINCTELYSERMSVKMEITIFKIKKHTLRSRIYLTFLIISMVEKCHNYP